MAEFGGDAGAGQELLDDYRLRSCAYGVPFPGMAETLAALRAKGLRLAIVSNGETNFQMGNVLALGLMEKVDAVLISEAEGLRKPDAAMFRRAARRLHAKPAQCLFVGDNPEADILGAFAAGMKTAWFNTGSVWPAPLPPNPGAEISELAQALALV